MTMIKYLLLVTFLFGSSICVGHNNFFLPGDAFFSVKLSREEMKEWNENSATEYVFDYTRFDGSFMACGSIGYSKIKLTNIGQAFKRSLTKAYERYEAAPIYRLDPDEELNQLNSVVALIYNSDFKGPLGLKLNEDWAIEGSGVYGGYLKHHEAILKDWRLGPKFKPLTLVKPLSPRAHLLETFEGHSPISDPILADMSKLKIFLVGHADTPGYFPSCPNLELIHEDESEYVTYYLVTEKGITEFRKKERYKNFTSEFTPVTQPRHGAKP